MNEPTLIEYKVREIKRYIVTRYEEGADDSNAANGKFAGSVSKGQYDNPDTAFEVAYALANEEHQALGWPLDDERIQYPRHWRESTAEQAANFPVSERRES